MSAGASAAAHVHDARWSGSHADNRERKPRAVARVIRAANSNYYASYARTSVDGYRKWSAQQRDSVNFHDSYRFSASTDARLFYFFADVKQELPGAFTRAQVDNAAGKWLEPADGRSFYARLRWTY